MASSSSTSLHMMSKLSDFVFSYEPSETSSGPSGSTTSASAPKLILFAAWMDAKDVYIAKYISHYQTMYPSSPILLVKFTLKETLSSRVADVVVQPAVWYVASLIRAKELSIAPERPEILVHAFSNGGSTTMRAIYTSFNRVFGRPFPLHAVVMDSCPGMAKLTSAYNAMILSYPEGFMRTIAAPFVVVLLISSWLYYAAFGWLVGRDFMTLNYKGLNDRSLVNQTSRSYIFGDKDLMVDCHHVEAHARDARSKGYDVRVEKFENSPHVAHMRTDGRRYWQIVKDTWDKGINKDVRS